MVRNLKTFLLVGALVIGTAPAHAAILTLPFVGDIEHPDMDPFHVITPEAPPAATTPAPAPKKHHKMKKRMKKKAM